MQRSMFARVLLTSRLLSVGRLTLCLIPFCVFPVCLLWALGSTAAGEGTEPAAAARSEGAVAVPTDLRTLGRSLDAIEKRVRRLMAEAKRDADEAWIQVYENYTHAQFKARKRIVRASMLVGYMADASKALAVRERAYRALADGPLHGDPDLSRRTKHGRMRERGYFGTKYVVDLLRDDDRQTRVFADKLLKKWWHVVGIAAIAKFNPDDPKTGKAAVDAWKKELRRRK